MKGYRQRRRRGPHLITREERTASGSSRVTRIRKGGGFTMDDIGTGLLLNLVFWIVSVSALVFMGVWAVVELFHGLMARIWKVRKTCSAPGCREDAPQSSEAPGESGEPYRKAS